MMPEDTFDNPLGADQVAYRAIEVNTLILLRRPLLLVCLVGHSMYCIVLVYEEHTPLTMDLHPLRLILGSYIHVFELLLGTVVYDCKFHT